MKRIYKRVKVNKEIYKTQGASPPLSQFLQNEVNETIPTGKVVGVYFNSYIDKGGESAQRVEVRAAVNNVPNFLSHTDITIKDSRGHLLTETTDIKDYEHKSGGYLQGFKNIDFNSQNERITIAWETIGKMPICGEFIFEIEVDNCDC